MFRATYRTLIAAALVLAVMQPLYAADEKPGGGEGGKGAKGGAGAMPTVPPANVVVAKATAGMLSPRAEFVGTVYFSEVSDVASEVSGGVESVRVEEGQRVKKGEVLVVLDSSILSKTIEATRASHGQVLSELERARLDFGRIRNLYREDSIAERVYDEHRFRVKGLEKKADSINAEVERLETELSKKSVLAPFGGVVIKRHVDRGEWLSPGKTVITLAGDAVEVVVDVPESVLRFIKRGDGVSVNAGGAMVRGSVSAVIPRGDISTRTFPVKIKLKNPGALMEGMKAGVSLPTGEDTKAVLVPRDAVITKFGTQVLFAVVDGKAVMIPVKVIGYTRDSAGVSAQGLTEGMDVVVKGNERIGNGQPVSAAGAAQDK